MLLIYKFVELSIVSDDMIEKCVNQWVGEGWQFDDIRFVTSNASRRPVMAFVSFVRAEVTVELAVHADAAVAELGAALEEKPVRVDALVSRAGDVADSAGSSLQSPIVRSRNALAALIERDEES